MTCCMPSWGFLEGRMASDFWSSGLVIIIRQVKVGQDTCVLVLYLRMCEKRQGIDVERGNSIRVACRQIQPARLNISIFPTFVCCHRKNVLARPSAWVFASSSVAMFLNSFLYDPPSFITFRSCPLLLNIERLSSLSMLLYLPGCLFSFHSFDISLVRIEHV